jgi:hypothetical protein
VNRQTNVARRSSGSKRNRLGEHKRRAVCEEAARIMAEESVRNYQVAKHKACMRLGYDHRRTPLPTNREIESAFAARLRLFRGKSLIERLRCSRQRAAEIMRLFTPFQPRLVGALLRGNVTDDTPIELHLFADNPEEVVDHLDQNQIPCQTFDKRVRFAGNRFIQVPGFRFSVDHGMVELLTFNRKQLREAPICPVDGRPMKRATLSTVESLVF